MEFLTSVLGSLWSIFLIVLFFGGSIFVHELGHFLAARRRGVKVERFSIGFGPKIFGWRGKDGVDYRVSWLPLGGYVALPQLADMAELEGGSSVDVQALPPVSYVTKVIVFVAGAVFNLIFAFLLATTLWQIGRPAPESVTTTKIGYVATTLKTSDGKDMPSPAVKAGLQVGDVIRKVDGRPVRDWLQFKSALVLSTSIGASGDRSAVLTIERDGQTRDIVVEPVRAGEDRFRTIGVAAAYLPVIEAVKPGSPAAQLGFQAGDRFVGANGAKMHSFDQLYDAITKSKGQSLELTMQRAGGEVRIKVPSIDEKLNPLSGLQLTVPYQLLHDTPWHQFADTVETTFRTLWSLLSPRGDVSASSLSGPIGIGRGFWDAAQSDYPLRFATLFAILVNINLAIFNLLPIPVLDGGHIVFATIGKLRGRPLPMNIIATTQSVFVVLLLSMMLYVTVFGDLRRWVRDYRAESAAKEQVEQQKKSAEPAK